MLDGFFQIASELEAHRGPVDRAALGATINTLRSYVRRRALTTDALVAIASLALDAGADAIGTSAFLRAFDIGDQTGAARLLAGFGDRSWERSLLFP